MATTAPRATPSRAITRPKRVGAAPPPKGRAVPSPKPTNTAPVKTLPSSKPVTPKSKLPTVPAAPQPTRIGRLMESVESVQDFSTGGGKPWPRWRKIALWAVLLTPIYAIIIYAIGGAYFIHAGLNGIGVNKAFQTHVLKVVNGISVPDQNGTFLQAGTDPTQPLNLIMEYNDRALKPPPDQQFTVKSGDLRYVLIRASQVSLPTDYQIFQIDSKDVDHLVKGVVGQRVPAERVALIALSPPAGQAWAPGQYVVVSPDLDGSSFYYYFFTVTK